MRVLFVGDVVGRPGRELLARCLPELRRREGPFDFVLANGENAAAPGGEGGGRRRKPRKTPGCGQ